MNRRQIGLCLVLNKLDVPDNINTFQNRTIIQRTIYMAQQRGVPLGYHFKWCLKGPYCQELTEDVAAVLGYTPEKNWVITESINDKLDDINQFLLHLKAEVLKGSFVENIIDVSIIQFILATGQAGKDSKAILKVLRKGKVCISEDRVQEVLRTLEIFSFFN